MRICAVTGSRADYGLLLPVLRGIENHPDLTLRLAVTGAHLSERHGNTARQIEQDGFRIDAKVDIPLDDDSPAAVTRSLGQAVIGFASALEQLQPDLLLVLGDRYEILGAVQAALIARVPVAHIAGGDVTEGAFDDAIRHGITKMAHLHFVTNEAARRRVIQLGENPANVHLTGSPGIDQLLATPLLNRATLEDSLAFRLRTRNLLITFHPETLAVDKPVDQLQQLLHALANLAPDIGLIITGANADPAGDAINLRWADFAAKHENAAVFSSLGQQRYYSLMRLADAVVGNSSSGLYEAPSFGTPTVNIGDRQKGRPRAASVIDCPAETAAIRQALETALTRGKRIVENPYGDGKAAERIVGVLANTEPTGALLRKFFHDLEFSE